MKRRILGMVAAGVLLLLGVSCKDGPTVGELNVNLTTPNSDDGAIQFIATATAPATITGATAVCGTCKLFLVKISDTQYKGVLTGPITAGTVFRVGVSDKKAVSSYSVSIQAVSTRAYTMRNSTSGYSFSLD